MGINLVASLILSILLYWVAPLNKLSENHTHYLIPFTRPEHLIPCKNYFDEPKHFNHAFECAVKHVNLKPDTAIPTCYIISESSPDLQYDKEERFNYISLTWIIDSKILGFYENTTRVLYITPNHDSWDIYEHELMHYFNDLATSDPDGRHTSILYKECSQPFYNPNKNRKEE